MMEMPPICSLLSMNGPSVVITRPSWLRKTVAVLGGYRPPPKTQAPASCNWRCTSPTSRMIFFSASGAGWVLPAG
jgi:hypothetical protein